MLKVWRPDHENLLDFWTGRDFRWSPRLDSTTLVTSTISYSLTVVPVIHSWLVRSGQKLGVWYMLLCSTSLAEPATGLLYYNFTVSETVRDTGKSKNSYLLTWLVSRTTAPQSWYEWPLWLYLRYTYLALGLTKTHLVFTSPFHICFYFLQDWFEKSFYLNVVKRNKKQNIESFLHGEIFLHWFRLNVFYFMFGFMLSNMACILIGIRVCLS